MGGAHVDPVLQEIYAELSRGNSLGWTSNTNSQAKIIEQPHLYAMRQISHEILRTIKTDMPTVIPAKPEGGILAMGMELTVGDKKIESSHPRVPKVGRNQPCPCGSGKKYKKCALALPI